MIDKKEQLIFIHQLRGIATIMVMLWHLTIMFWYSNDNISTIFSLKPIEGGKDNLNFIYTNIVDALTYINLDFGMFGVAVFFLISGFIIPYSIEKDNNIKDKLLFILKRILRIWPTYICGFSITFLSLFLYSKITEGDFTYSIKDYFVQISLLRDWFWVPSIDGISWTLEVEIKFYVLILILLLIGKIYDKYMIVFVGIFGMIFNIVFYANDEWLILHNVRIYQIMSVIGDSFSYITFVLIGLIFYCYHSGKWSKRSLIIVFQCLIFSLLLSIINSVNSSIIEKFIVNYGGAIILFLNFYFTRDVLKGNKILNFVADKSYAIYLLHGLLGYILLSMLFTAGFPVWVCLIITFSIVIILAMIVNLYVEKPVQHISKLIINKLQ